MLKTKWKKKKTKMKSPKLDTGGHDEPFCKV